MSNRMTARTLLIILIFAALCFSGCVDRKSPPIGGTGEYGQNSNSFKGHWWNYYERGRSYADEKLFSKAAADFTKAVEGREYDQWHAPTENSNFIDYFPHRELGIVYYNRKQYEEAIAELNQSVQNAPSARAYYFLNQARAAKLHTTGRDMSPPELFIDGSTGTRLTNGLTSTIKGVAIDDSFVASINVGGIAVPVELAAKQKVFTVEVPLKEGDNDILISATDLVGKTVELNFKILCDRSGPLVEILQEHDEGGKNIIDGVIGDTGGLKSLIVNGEAWKISGRSPAYSFKFSEPKDPMTIVATDNAGNITRAVLRKEFNYDDLLMHLPPVIPETSSTQQPPAVHSDEQMPPGDLPKTSPADIDPPLIQMEGLGTEQEIYENHVLLEGMVADPSPITSFSVNGVPFPGKKGRKLYFSRRVKLEEGDNKFHLIAIDTHGNRSEKKITITRKIQNIRKIGARLAVAIIPFDNKGVISPVSEILYDLMIDSFQQLKRFNVIERTKIDAVLQKLDLGLTDLVAQDEALEFGRMLGADTILTGDIIESADSVEIIGHLIDAATGSVLASNDVFSANASTASLKNQLDNLAVKFKQNFPLVEGIVTEVNNDWVQINIGSENNLRQNLRLLCYRMGMEMRHPVTGKIVGAEPEILGELIVKEVFKDFSKTIRSKPKDDVKMFDQVIAK